MRASDFCPASIFSKDSVLSLYHYTNACTSGIIFNFTDLGECHVFQKMSLGMKLYFSLTVYM